jgi:hypothetical protein
MVKKNKNGSDITITIPRMFGKKIAEKLGLNWQKVISDDETLERFEGGILGLALVAVNLLPPNFKLKE